MSISFWPNVYVSVHMFVRNVWIHACGSKRLTFYVVTQTPFNLFLFLKNLSLAYDLPRKVGPAGNHPHGSHYLLDSCDCKRNLSHLDFSHGFWLSKPTIRSCSTSNQFATLWSPIKWLFFNFSYLWLKHTRIANCIS